ncbi:MAG: 50S ribosomal protein L21 [Balneolaceae bacterium]
MYAVVEIGGHQYKVAKDDRIFVNRLNEDAETITIDQVLLLKGEDGEVRIGQPVIDGAKVEARIVDHQKGDKVIVFKKKRRKGYRVKRGHRQLLTQLHITSIS